MVGTGRIELPTSSVSRKRSPTELRACKIRREELVWLEQTNINASFLPWLRARGSCPGTKLQNSARDRFYYQFPSRMSTRTADRRGSVLQPDQTPVEILASGNNRYNGCDTDEDIEHRWTQEARIVEHDQCDREGTKVKKTRPPPDTR